MYMRCLIHFCTPSGNLNGLTGAQDPIKISLDYLQEIQLLLPLRFCNQMYFFDLSNRTVSPDFAREYPADYEVTSQGVAWNVMGTPFLGPDSCICVCLPPFNNDGTFRVTNSPFEEWAQVTIVDRYNRNGEYLDSFCIPVRGVFDCIYSQEYGLLVNQYSTSTIYRLEISY